MRARRLKTLLGDHPVTEALKQGRVTTGALAFDYADVKVPHTAFKRVVRELEFDVAELAIMTFLLAKAHGKPLKLLPTVLTARLQHPFIVYNAGRGQLAPGDLEGRRVGQRSFSVTTATWIRGILAEDYGVDLAKVRWVTFEEPHVAEFRDPPNVERAPAGKDVTAMLLAGELDAAIVGEPPKDPRIKTLFADPAAAGEAWKKKRGAIQINHMVAVRQDLDCADEVYRLLGESRRAAGNPPGNPFGVEENRRNLEAAIDCAHRQKMIPYRFSIEELLR
ncbi:MAG TPA: phosphate ABC transporter substrate-binding protein [Burkholderiales bacterium]|nr:phosphate ABC transporter substrate-binding protein [Burkholderiales bacterium]